MLGRPHPDPHWIAVFRSRADADRVEGRLVDVTEDAITVETAYGRVTYQPVDTARVRHALATGGFRPDEKPSVWVQERWRVIRVPLPSGGGTYMVSTRGARKQWLPQRSA